MNQTNNGSKLASVLIFVGDLIIINSIFYLLLQIFNISVSASVRSDYVFISLSYVISALLGGDVILFRRRVRGDQIVNIQFGNILKFVIVWLSLLGLLEIVYHNYWFYLVFFVAVSISFLIYRLMCRAIVKQMRNSGRNRCNVVFVGSSSNMLELYNEMTGSRATGYVVDGYFDIEPKDNFPAKYLGTPAEVNKYLETSNVERLYCSLPSALKDEILPIISYCESHLVRYYSVPNLRNYLHRRVSLEMFSETPILSIHPEPLSKVDNRIVKRTFDIIFSLCFLCTIFPIIVVIFGTMIKLSSKGPIFFKQRRNGINGKEFWCYKFRSMKVNNSADTQQAVKGDARTTKVGEFMRKTSIDELPQFLNVLIGNMSVVGPRPHMLRHTEEYSQLISTYMVRHFVKPGVTGWAQVTGYRGETRELKDMEGRIKADIWYMEHWTFALDLLIILKTTVSTILINDEQAF